MFSPDAIIKAIQQVVGPASPDYPIALHEPDFRGTHAWAYVKDCLDSGWVSTAGCWVTRFENELCSITGATHAVAVTNGTVALRLALHLAGVRAGDEVLLPPLSFVATANAVSHLGAVPHFVDIDPSTLAMSPTALDAHLQQVADRRGTHLFNRQTGRRLAAILPVHVFGLPADGVALRQISDAWGLPLVEDAAEALGSWRGGTHCGLFGLVGTLSFNGNKLITTGGGGALITNDSELAQTARHLSTTAKRPHPWEFEHDVIGWNDRLPNLNASLGVAQLEDLDRRLAAKRRLAQKYTEAFKLIEDVELLTESPGTRTNNWLLSIRLTTKDVSIARTLRDHILEHAHAKGILLRPIWRSLHTLPMYQNCPAGILSEAEDQAYRLISLPSSPQLSTGFVP